MSLSDALKKRLRELDWDDIAREDGRMGSTLTGWMPNGIEVDWEKLDQEIDKFCAEFAGAPLDPKKPSG